MTKAATVVRHNDDMRAAYAKVCELEQQAARCSMSDTAGWANQNVVFARALEDMFPLAKAILQGAIARDECRGAHYKPEFAMRRDPRRRSGRAAPRGRGVVRPFRGEQPQVAEVDDRRLRRRRRAAVELRGGRHHRSIPPRPRLYGVAGGDVIEQVWKERQRARRSKAR